LKRQYNWETYAKEKQWLLREKYGGEEIAEFFEDTKRLEAGEPIDYLIGFFEFLGCKIDLSFYPLIPRTETEWWVEKVIQGLNDRVSRYKILDLFAGSGCIGIALLKHLRNASVDFGEKRPSFVAQIEKNITINDIDTNRARVFTSDIFANIPARNYDFIFANPPYLSRAKIKAVQKSVLDYEPGGALFAADDGLFYIKKLLIKAPRFLAPNGKLFVEFDSRQKKEIETLTAGSHFRCEFWKDQFDRWRVAVFSL
jgi:HemK-like putative methylase